MEQTLLDKLEILADSAKYDVSCASSGVNRSNTGALGNATACGICHTWSADGRCVSLLKVLHTNACVYDCAYCVNRITNDVPRASFTSEEVAELTMEFYRRNYIEGLFLSSAVEKNPHYTMEKICRTLFLLRRQYGFAGYIHAKLIPGADPALIRQAGELADRVSVNIELPTVSSLRSLAPQKNPKLLVAPMVQIRNSISGYLEDQRHFRSAPSFAPSGQSTQMIIGATPDTDYQIINTTENLYQKYRLKRVYYSAYVPVNHDARLPALNLSPPMKREHRLYQADWLLRFYRFEAKELLDETHPFFDLEFDPKINWAFHHMDQFPMEINRADYEELLRIPGIGPTSAQRIVRQRALASISYDTLRKMGVVLKRAKYFITCGGKFYGDIHFHEDNIKNKLRCMENPKPYTHRPMPPSKRDSWV